MTPEHPSPAELPGRIFVGRKPELGALRAGLERALAGRGSVVLVAGEPGIGKSELADRLGAEAASRGAEVLWGRSWEGEGQVTSVSNRQQISGRRRRVAGCRRAG